MGFRGRYANKRDSNEPVIVQALESHGVVVVRMDQPVDLLCLYRGRPRLVEVKTEDAKTRKDQPRQNEFLDLWPVDVLRTVEDVRECVTRWREGDAE